MRPEANYEKWMEMSRLNRGDKVKLISGEIVEFQSLKQKNFVAKKLDGTLWKMHVNSFHTLAEKAPAIDKAAKIVDLKFGELFYVLHKDQTVIFKFENIKGRTLNGINPVTGGKTRMDIDMYGGKVSEL